MQNSADQNESERIDLVKFFHENEINGTAPISDQAWCVGPVEMFTFRSAYNFGKLYIDKYVHLTKEVEPNFWNCAAQFLIEPIAEALNDVLGYSSYYPFIVRNISNSKNQRNIDFGIENKYNKFSIYGEVSYSDEDISELITDCVMFLNDYQPVNYSIGIKIDRNSQFFDLFILENTYFSKESDNRPNKLLIENYFANNYKPNEKIIWDLNVDKEDIKKCFFKNDMAKYGKKICFSKRITEENCNDELNFELNLEKIQPDKFGFITLTIPIESLKFANFIPRYLNHNIDEDDEEVSPIGTIDEFTFNSVQQLGKILIQNGNIYILKFYNSNVHSLAIACLSQSILNAVNSKKKKFLAPVNQRVNVKNKFSCGTVYTKEVDFTIYHRKETPIIGEVSFQHETFKNLITECLLYLTEYVDCNYAIGMKIYDRKKFQADLFVLERDELNKVDNRKVEELRVQIEKQIKENKFGTTSKKLTKNFDPDLCEKKNQILDDFMNNDLIKYGIRIKYNIRIGEEHLNTDIRFSLKSKLINFESENQEIQVVIESDDLIEIFSHWNEYKRL